MGSVKLILREDVNKLGAAGDLVAVKPGYARNYLLPKGIASVATESSIKELAHQQRVIADKLAKELTDHQAVAHKLQSIVIEATRRAGEDGKLFGSVTSQNIADMLAEKGLEIDRRRIQLRDSIKEIGEHSIEIKLHSEVSASIKLVVAAEE